MRPEAIFPEYAKGLARLDPELVVPYYGYPCMMLTDTFVGALNSADELRAALTQANEFYRQFGVTDVTYEIVSVEELTPSITRVRLTWTFLGSSGKKLLDSDYEYVMRNNQIHVVVSIDEQEKIAALLADKVDQ